MRLVPACLTGGNPVPLQAGHLISSSANAAMAPGTGATLTFSLKVPTAVEKTNYFGQSCLMRFNFSFTDIGQYLDRGVFVFEVH